jgi:protein SCO1/2
VLASPPLGQQPSRSAPQSSTQQYFTDVELINQDNQKMRLYSDLMKGKIIIMNSFFATDQGSSLPMNRNLKKIQDAFGERGRNGIVIFSISVDPTTDTPSRLKNYAKEIGAGPGWYFLTGDKNNVELALHKFGQYVENKQDHSNIIIIGNEPSGLWKKAFGLGKSDDLIKVVQSVVNDKPQ